MMALPCTVNCLKYLTPLVLLALVGCASTDRVEQDSAPRHAPVDLDNIPNAIPRAERPNPANQRTYTVLGKTYQPLKTSKDFVQRGIASWYGSKFHGRKTANGERYNMYAMTAAHKRLPLPTYVQVDNLENGRSIVVRVNDRGPFYGGRVIDLSYAAAHKLGMLKKGTAQVKVQVVGPLSSDAHTLPEPTRQEPLSDNPRIFIQAGAFNQLQNAQQLQLQLQQNLQRRVSVEAGQTAHGNINRVLIGPLASHEIAENITRQLLDMAIHDSKLINR